MSHKMFGGAVLATALVLGGATAQAQHVSTDYNHSTDFSAFHTFSIYKVHASNGIVEDRIRQDIADTLREKGLQQVESGGDVAITAIGDVKNQQEYSTFYDGFGPGWGWGGGWYGWGGGGWGGGPATTTVYNIPKGTLAIDVFDAHTHQLVFRGTATQTVSKHGSTNARNTAKDVTKIFDKLPVKRQG